MGGLDAKTAGALIGKGVAMGIVHVLTGPDHLSAIAALAANTSYVHSISYGMRWGVGHSLGLLAVTVVFLSVGEQAMNLDQVGSAFEWLVGIMMILLGVYTGWRAVHSEYYLHKGDDDANTHTAPLPPPPLLPTAHTRLLPPPPPAPPQQQQQQVEMSIGEGPTTSSELQPKHEGGGGGRSVVKWLQGLKERMLATVVGTVHGVAGPGGVLGVLPAVELHAWDKALLYLFSFCLTSIVVMGAFAGLWGEMSYRLGLHWRERKVAFGFQLFSACLSLTVGVLWLVLKSCGLLEQVFG